VLSYEFFIVFSSSVTKIAGILIVIALNLKLTLGSMYILAILVLPNQENERERSFHFLVSFLSVW
jgi:phage shock protein PspC (stress-responsive transcriptional regulator)